VPRERNAIRTHRRSLQETVSEIRLHLLGHFLYGLIALLLGAGVGIFATANLENATYLKLDADHRAIGGTFDTKLVFVKAETLESPTPICTFSYGTEIANIRVHTVQTVGDYMIDLAECDPKGQFAVAYVRKVSYFERALAFFGNQSGQ
jgi:hypothetical protein